MHYNRRFVGYFMGTYQAIMGGGSRWRSLPLPEAAGQRRHKEITTQSPKAAHTSQAMRRTTEKTEEATKKKLRHTRPGRFLWPP